MSTTGHGVSLQRPREAFRYTVYLADYKPDNNSTGTLSLARQMQLDKTDKE
jgi:hypothetical protein